MMGLYLCHCVYCLVNSPSKYHYHLVGFHRNRPHLKVAHLSK